MMNSYKRVSGAWPESVSDHQGLIDNSSRPGIPSHTPWDSC